MSILLSRALFSRYNGLFTAVGDRVYPRTLPKIATMPAIVYQVIPAVGPLKTHDDAHTGLTVGTYMRVRVQWDVWANTYDQMTDLAQELRQSLHGYNGYWGPLKIASIHTDLDFDSYDQEIDKYRRIIDCMVQFNEPARA